MKIIIITHRHIWKKKKKKRFIKGKAVIVDSDKSDGSDESDNESTE